MTVKSVNGTRGRGTGNASSRRRFLKQTTFGVLALSTANLIPHSRSAPPLPSSVEGQLKYFSSKEYLIVKSVSDRFVGPSVDGTAASGQIDAALRADFFLAGADPEIQEQFHQLLTVFNAPLFTFLFDFRLSSFINMKPADQDSYLEDWMTSPLGFRRTGFQALKRTCLSMFYTDQRAWSEIGFEGMDVPQN
ncbi:MAG TPA: twin-arginine translocation signal domain-containing protein [Bacteroidota bacterium]|nr:twin-arginine translocation signal domain-containing protein [Bacteroidota bacterium]